MSPVVGDLLPGFDKLVVDTVAKMVDKGNPCQDGVITAESNPDHLTVDSNHFRQSRKKEKQ